MKKENLLKFSEDMSVIDWSELFEEKECPIRALYCLMEVIIPIYERTCTVKVFKSKKLVPRRPWITEETIDQIELRNRLYKTYSNSKKW